MLQPHLIETSVGAKCEVGAKIIYLIGRVSAPITLRAALLTYHDASATNNLRTGGFSSSLPVKFPQDSEGRGTWSIQSGLHP